MPYTKNNGNLKKQSQCKTSKQQKDYLKCASKPSYMSHKIFDNTLIATCKSKLALKLNKPAYTGISILQLNKVLMYKFNYDYIKNKYKNKSKVVLIMIV